ncbi:hypothetical protein [Xanthomonas euvesicatoria]|uniref:Uncharacterized protein n=1 Tax=Xanthomonas euvesicatoria TaxID=456327 RepID=A0AAW3U3X5_XANEU|nr:hypothetical protein [Xanthomonas euvesicatoria]MBB4723813.1 hypothetical protein [Xanthomonas euvesicatoria]MBB4870657.1 hypothetical protein [Xanthomonas euvesicatoria]MDH4909407.1 hypothetical protein [Xanthomonas euvesicatoria]
MTDDTTTSPLKNLSQAQSAIFADRMMLEDGEGHARITCNQANKKTIQRKR